MLEELAQFNRLSPGCYVDVGAYHPFRFSNTAIYYARGWRGINIDATPGSMKAFRRCRLADTNLECAVSLEAGVRTFFQYNEPALNGIDCDRTAELKGTAVRLTGRIPVEAVPLADILRRHLPALPTPNFLSVDAEGHDLDVLRSNDWSAYPFQWVLAEALRPDGVHLPESPVADFLREQGYRLRAFTGRTSIFSHQSVR